MLEFLSFYLSYVIVGFLLHSIAIVCWIKNEFQNTGNSFGVNDDVIIFSTISSFSIWPFTIFSLLCVYAGLLLAKLFAKISAKTILYFRRKQELQNGKTKSVIK